MLIMWLRAWLMRARAHLDNYGVTARWVFLVLLSSVAPVLTASESMALFDVHSHFTEADAGELSHERIRALLDRNGVQRMAVIGRPAELALELQRAYPERFLAWLGPYRKYRDKENWYQDADLPARLREQLQQGDYAGLGEFHLFAPQRLEPVFRQVVLLAQEHELPLLLHGDAQVVSQALAWAPRLRVIWAHLGTRPLHGEVHKMLQAYPQRLYVDTSVRDQRFVRDGRLLPGWRALFIDYADRMMVGIDTYDTGRWRDMERVVADIRLWLNQLPKDVAEKIAGGNARRVFQAPR